MNLPGKEFRVSTWGSSKLEKELRFQEGNPPEFTNMTIAGKTSMSRCISYLKWVTFPCHVSFQGGYIYRPREPWYVSWQFLHSQRVNVCLNFAYLSVWGVNVGKLHHRLSVWNSHFGHSDGMIRVLPATIFC